MSLTQELGLNITAIGMTLVSPAALFSRFGSLFRAEKIVANKADEAFHYTFSSRISSIESQGLRPGQYATPNGNLSPLQAQIDLALPPNRGLTDSVLRVDLDGLRSAGYKIPEFTPVGRSFNMPGGGYEVQFPYAVPPEFIKVVPK